MNTVSTIKRFLKALVMGSHSERLEINSLNIKIFLGDGEMAQ